MVIYPIKRDIFLVIMIVLFFGCSFMGDSINKQTNIDIKTSGEILRIEDSRTKSWGEIMPLLQKIHIGTSAKQVISILGEPHMKASEKGKDRYHYFIYLERPDDIGMMNYAQFIFDNGRVQDIKMGEMSIDPW